MAVSTHIPVASSVNLISVFIRDRMGPERRSGSFFRDRNGVPVLFMT